MNVRPFKRPPVTLNTSSVSSEPWSAPLLPPNARKSYDVLQELVVVLQQIASQNPTLLKAILVAARGYLKN